MEQLLKKQILRDSSCALIGILERAVGTQLENHRRKKNHTEIESPGVSTRDKKRTR